MYIATLLTNPATPRLTGAMVEALQTAWGGGTAAWLDPDIAAEFPLDRVPDNRWDVWESLQAEGVDLLVQPAAGRKKKMLLADMDSTMIGQECIDELAAAAGVGDRVADITARAMNGELDFEGALTERVGLLAGLPEAVIAEVLAERITPAPGGAQLVATMRAQGAWTVLVSGGFTAFSREVAAWLGFDETRANALLIEAGRLTGQVAQPILGRAAKVETLERVARARGIAEADVLAVGDGANDLGMLHRAGTGVALHAKPAVAAECDLRVNHGDLTALLYLQGYSQAEFALPDAA
ncbi:phosphoserine phosphatase SerB [Rhodovulum sp. YNF3179]|uniref:phosphoserine phosphatase SerB n=1 Tax=Rhodovulum sp. YNF3179 TaxID=3425127 RepID=UPI003D333C63